MTLRQPLLHDLRVLDFSRALAGPFCTALPADVGAEVIEIELPLERLVRDVRIMRIYEGASEVQKNIIARKILR